ncbi:MAG: cobalamin B12-binding domain-containing protein [Candidatus Delongbacteria bacterium]|nr:cobalamin B12-binding domain-containing protein [Candidatus Delongbacteria bacterium]
MTPRRILMVPYDPVHDVGLKVIKQELEKRGHPTRLLPPDLKNEDILKEITAFQPEYLLLSRTLGYGVAELLTRFLDILDGAGLRDTMKIAIGGMAVTRSLAAELGFDMGFTKDDPIETLLAYVEEREPDLSRIRPEKNKIDLTEGYGFTINDTRFQPLLEEIADKTIQAYRSYTSPGIERARIRREWIRRKRMSGGNQFDSQSMIRSYLEHSDATIRAFYEEGRLPAKTRFLSELELKRIQRLADRIKGSFAPVNLRHYRNRPAVFTQYGTGCPLMDIMHIKTSEAWGSDGVLHFDPSWGARTEGFLAGHITHQEDGTVMTFENLDLISKVLEPYTLWSIRAHRGLNTPETAMLAGELGADLTKINLVYGALGAGTDPERLVVDGLECLRYAAEYKLPYDIPTNDELCGVPAYKAYAGMLIVAYLGMKLEAQPILKPLFCISPEVMINGQADRNYVDYNMAKIAALRHIIDCPVWPGEPIGFITHQEERIQSSTTTSMHALIAAGAGVDAVTVASTDEAYSRGPITIPAKTDTLSGLREIFRDSGTANLQPTPRMSEFADQLIEQILGVLQSAVQYSHLTEIIHSGVLGDSKEGVYPGRNGKNSVRSLS